MMMFCNECVCFPAASQQGSWASAEEADRLEGATQEASVRGMSKIIWKQYINKVLFSSWIILAHG